MKKRTWLLLLAFALLLMAGCSSEKTMDGTITEYLRGDTEVNAFLMEQDGKTIGVRLTGETGIYPALVDITDEALRNAEYPHMEVTVTGEKAEEKLTAADGTEVPTYTASVIIINSIPYGEPLTLEDGTTVQVRLNREGLAYYAPDGMMLLQIYNQIPDDIFVDRVDFDVFPKEAQQKVIDHYEELGFFYDTAYQVERAWAEYNELGCPKDFRAYVARQSTATSYYNDRVIFYCTNVTLSRNTRRNYEKYYNAVYDRKTGEQVSFWSLFKPDENYMRQWLLVQLEPLDADRRNQLAEVLSPEWLSLGYNGLYTFIPWDVLPGGDGPYQCTHFYADEELTSLLQDWVFPLKDPHGVSPDVPAPTA